jgi:hypothetical protein
MKFQDNYLEVGLLFHDGDDIAMEFGLSFLGRSVLRFDTPVIGVQVGSLEVLQCRCRSKSFSTIIGTEYSVCNVFLASALDSAAMARLYGTAMLRLCSKK